MKSIVWICVIFIASILSYVYGYYDTESDIVVSDNERWGDINNLKIREDFCKYQGYDSSSVTGHLGVIKQGNLTGDYAPSPYYEIICIKTKEETRTFDYIVYKKWMIGVNLK